MVQVSNRDLEEQIKLVDAKLSEKIDTLDKRLSAFRLELKSDMDEIKQLMKQMLGAINALGRSNPGAPSPSTSGNISVNQISHTSELSSFSRAGPINPVRVNRDTLNFSMPEVDFPKFNADDNPRGWLRRVNQYFEFFSVPEALRFNMVMVSAKGKIGNWIECYLLSKNGEASWEEFCTDLCRRFVALEGVSVEDDFRMLKQTGSLRQHTTRFEELMSMMLDKHPSLSRSFFVENYVSSLNDQLKYAVAMHGPKTLLDAFKLAQLCEKCPWVQKLD